MYLNLAHYDLGIASVFLLVQFQLYISHITTSFPLCVIACAPVHLPDTQRSRHMVTTKNTQTFIQSHKPKPADLPRPKEVHP